MALAGGVKGGGADLGAFEVENGEAVERSDVSFQETVSDSRLPRAELRPEGNCSLYPLVGLAHQFGVPADRAAAAALIKEFLLGAAVEAGVDRAAAAENSASRVRDSFLGDECLRGGIVGVGFSESGEEAVLACEIGEFVRSSSSL